MIYAVVYVLLCLLVPFGVQGGRANTALSNVVCFALFIFVGFRWEVGCDWTGYEAIFEQARNQTINDALVDREPGFALLNAFIHWLGLDYTFLNVASALFFFVGLAMFANRQRNPLAIIALAFPVLIMNMPMTAMRQGIAIGFFMVALNYYRRARVLPFASAVVVGGAFHQSALLFLAFAPLISRKRTAVTVGLSLLLVSPALYVVASNVLGFYADRYLDDPRDSAGAVYRGVLLCAVGVVFFAFLRRRWQQRYPSDYFIFAVASLLMIAMLPIAVYAPVTGDRFGYYLIPFQLIALERIAVLFEGDRFVQIFNAAPYLVLLIFFIAWMNLSPLFAGCYLPYQTVILGAG